MIEGKFSFTKLFISYRRFGYSQVYGNFSQKHPFVFQETHLDTILEMKHADDAYKIYREIKGAEESSFSTVEIETSLLEDFNRQIKYINQCLDILIKLHNRNKKKNRLFFSSKELEYYPLIQNSIKNLILTISHNFAYLLNPYNRDYYFSLVQVKAPLLSFKFKKQPKDDHFAKLFKQHLVNGGFISSDEEGQFKSFFEGRRMERKINWLGPKNTLCYFIKLLKRSNLLQEHKHSHWAVTAEFFILKGKPIEARQLLNHGKPQSQIKVNNLENFVKLIL